MRITNFSPLPDPGGGTVAHFDVQITDDVRLVDWALKLNGAGEYRAYPPRARHRSGEVVIVSSAMMSAIRAAATAELIGGARPHDYRNAA